MLPLLVHGPQVVLVQDDGQHPGVLGDVEGPQNFPVLLRFYIFFYYASFWGNFAGIKNTI
jgi:hypothetical protein